MSNSKCKWTAAVQTAVALCSDSLSSVESTCSSLLIHWGAKHQYENEPKDTEVWPRWREGETQRGFTVLLATLLFQWS